MGRVLRPGPGSIEGLRWLARVGPAPLEAWRCAMGWSEVATRNHARRLEREGWLERHPMTRGQGSLFIATRTGVAVLGISVRAAGPPAPTWWAHHCGCAWAAAWLTARGRELLGGRELLEAPAWSGEIRWHDHKGYHRSGHRPDLVVLRNGGRIAVEVELAQKSAERLKAIIGLHARWRAARATGGVIYICADEDGCDRIRTIAERTGLLAMRGGGLRVELLDTIRAQALAACERTRANRAGARPGVGSTAVPAVAHGS
jgi:hypothetical protein